MRSQFVKLNQRKRERERAWNPWLEGKEKFLTALVLCINYKPFQQRNNLEEEEERENQRQSKKMFRNQYDTDVTTWSPTGRLFQVEYAMEAVKQGSAAIGLRSRSHVVLACVNKAQSELSSHQKKIFKVDDHIGVAIAGLTADGRVLSRYMRSESINHSFTYESPLPVGRLVVHLADKAQVSLFVDLVSCKLH